MKKFLLIIGVLLCNLFATHTISEDELREDIVVTAAQLLGSPYRSGGKSPAGFDCSGFVNFVLSSNQISIARSSADIIHEGVEVLLDAVKPGDLLVFKGANKNSSRPGHSAIVHHISDNGIVHFIHSASSKGITIDDMGQAYYKSRFLGARDIVSFAISGLND